MENLKDVLTTIAAVIAAIGGFIVALSQMGLTMPSWLIILAGAIPAFCTTIIGIFTGKNADGSAKTTKQINNALTNK